MKRRRIISCILLVIAAGTAWHWYSNRLNRAPIQLASQGFPHQWQPIFDNAMPFPQRLALARRIDSSLPLPVVASWASALNPRDNSTRDWENHIAIYNEIADQSRHRNLHPVELTSFLMGAVGDASLPPVLRDYAAQHLSLWIADSGNGQPAETDGQRRRTGLELLCRIIGDPTVRDSTLPGTVLLALGDLEGKQPAALAPYWDDLDHSLSALIGRGDTPRSLRLSAIQMAATSGRSLHLPAIRLLVAAPRQDEAVLLTAVAALGRLGDRNDRALLHPIIQGGGIASHAATASLARLQP